MPEDDTLHRIERALLPLIGQDVLAFRLPRLGIGSSVVGDVVTEVEAIGKNLLILFSGGLVLHTHLKMIGLWHRYARGEPWRRRNDLAVAVVTTGTYEAVCFQAPLVRWCRGSLSISLIAAETSMTCPLRNLPTTLRQTAAAIEWTPLE